MLEQTIKIKIKFISKFFTKNILCAISKNSEIRNRGVVCLKIYFLGSKIYFQTLDYLM